MILKWKSSRFYPLVIIIIIMKFRQKATQLAVTYDKNSVNVSNFFRLKQITLIGNHCRYFESKLQHKTKHNLSQFYILLRDNFSVSNQNCMKHWLLKNLQFWNNVERWRIIMRRGSTSTINTERWAITSIKNN